MSERMTTMNEDWGNPLLAALAEIFSKTADGVFGVSQDNKVTLWNEAAERLLGYKAAEVLGRPCSEIIGGRDRSGRRVCGLACSPIMSARKGEPVHGFEVLIQTKAGRPIWIHVSAIVVPSRTPDRFTLVHIFRDVTRQVETEILLTKVQSLLAREAEPPDGARPQPGEIPSPLSVLTAREQQVLRLIARGESAKGVAEQLRISPATARNHTQKILTKLRVHTKLEAVVLAFRYEHI
jgi:PAS domain S-box-containing protein